MTTQYIYIYMYVCMHVVFVPCFLVSLKTIIRVLSSMTGRGNYFANYEASTPTSKRWPKADSW